MKTRRCEFCRCLIKPTYMDGVLVNECISEFCMNRGNTDWPDWRTAKVGTYCLYPCRRCGCVIEDELSKVRICSTCGPLHDREQLLKEALKLLPKRKDAKLENFKTRAQKAIRAY